MTLLRISEKIIELRRKKGITQEELASFLCVTKASVSKWETKQSFPDILLLPQIATFFNVSIDYLLGYEPQLSPEQIKKCYHEIAEEFSRKPFEEVMQESKDMVKEYYSCYPFLLQIVILWINHFMLTEDKIRQIEILNDIGGLCDHICEGSNDVGLCSDGLVLKAMVNIQLGKTQEVIDILLPVIEPKRFITQADGILIQAYQMEGNILKADYYSQISTYSHLLSLVSNSIGMIGLHMQNRELCETTISRITKIIDTYDLENLHPNTTLQFHYQTAVFYCAYKQNKQALDELKIFVYGSIEFLKKGIALHGDAYFNRLDEWFEEFALGVDAPRNEKVIWDSIVQALENPAFSIVFDDDEYKRLMNCLVRKGE